MQIKKKIKALILGVMAFCSCNSLAEGNQKSFKISIIDNCASGGGKIFVITKSDWQEELAETALFSALRIIFLKLKTNSLKSYRM